MSDVMHLSDFLFFAGFIMLLAAIALVVLLGRRAGARSAARNVSAANFTEMAILYQTMRNVIHDQKSLAKDFNRSVDRKLALVRQVVGKIAEEHNRIIRIHEDLQKRFAEAGQELDVLRSEVRRLRGELGLNAAAEPKAARASETPPLQVVVEPRDVDVPADLADLWVGFDLLSDAPETPEAPEAPPETPGDIDATRQAFRALLNMTAESGREPQRNVAGAAEAVAVSDGGNGRGGAAALRSRVYEYHDAGMSLAEIAQELGIGKGEIRLMLSLRQKGKP